MQIQMECLQHWVRQVIILILIQIGEVDRSLELNVKENLSEHNPNHHFYSLKGEHGFFRTTGAFSNEILNVAYIFL